MRAIYIAKGSPLLPPDFVSIFDDLASSSLDVFFDPSRALVTLPGLTLGMSSALAIFDASLSFLPFPFLVCRVVNTMMDNYGNANSMLQYYNYNAKLPKYYDGCLISFSFLLLFLTICGLCIQTILLHPKDANHDN